MRGFAGSFAAASTRPAPAAGGRTALGVGAVVVATGVTIGAGAMAVHHAGPARPPVAGAAARPGPVDAYTGDVPLSDPPSPGTTTSAPGPAAGSPAAPGPDPSAAGPSGSGQAAPGGAEPTRAAPGGAGGVTPATANPAAPTPARSTAKATGAGRAIVSYANGRCVDVPSHQPTDGSHLDIWDCDGAPWQQWTAGGDGSLRAMGLCLDVAWDEMSAGTPVQVAVCNGGEAQKFRLNEANDLVNTVSGMCVDVRDNGGGNGTALQLWTCAGSANQKWHW